MNEKEVAELRRRFRPDKSAITHVRGCYVNENGEIVAQFDQPLSMMTQEEGERLLTLLRKTLGGGLGKNLRDISFETQQVVSGEEHKLLMALRDTKLREEGVVQALFEKIIGSVHLDGNYLILLAHDAYDVPYRSGDGEKQDDASDQVFSYFLCSICPVKQTKPALSFYVQENAFHSLSPDWVVAAPELGFLFPAFDDRSANIYGALYYSKDLSDSRQDFMDAVFHVPAPMAPETQKETFQTVLGESLEKECSLQVVQAVQGELYGLMEEHKLNHEDEPLTISKGTVSNVLSVCGVDKERVSAFEDAYQEQFGGDAQLSPRNLMDPKQMEVKTPDVTIRVSTERAELVQTKIIDGAKYILIRAEDGVEVNGVPIHIE